MAACIQLWEYLPATFAERGVSVPFTAPTLVSARVRRSERDGLEYIVANPSGGAGYYVMSWGALDGLCKGTMHDQMLARALSSIAEPTPRKVRRAARDLAQTGAAGRPAGRAAEEADLREQEAALIARLGLLKRLASQAGVVCVDWEPLGSIDTALHDDIRRSLRRLETLFAADIKTILTLVDDMAPAVAAIGFGDDDRYSRHHLQLADVSKLAQSLKAFSDADKSDASAAALALSREALLCWELGLKLLAACREELKDVNVLLKRRLADPLGFAARFEQLEWLLDGWPVLCGLWDAAPGDCGARREAIYEIERALPVLPKIVATWATVPYTNVVRPRQWIKANTDWRSGLVTIDRIARNEWLRANTI